MLAWMNGLSGRYLALTAWGLVAFAGLASTAKVAAQRPRVLIDNQTLVTDGGQRLRGTTFFVDLYGVPDMRQNESMYREYFDSIFKDRALNCVRISPWMGRWKYDISGNEEHQRQYLYIVDTLVRWCAENNVYAIVNLHIEYKTNVDVEKAKSLWSVLAPRYHDQTHVIYELLNEPEPKSSLAGMSEIYQHVRGIAPETHLILFSHVAATQFTEDNLKTASVGIDYDNASVGFHCYDSVLTRSVQWDQAEQLREAGYPMICTEFVSLTDNNHMPISYDHLMHCAMRAEDRELAWISWGPFAQYRNPNKKGWTNEALRYSEKFEEKLAEYGIGLDGNQSWPTDDAYQIQCVWGEGMLTNSSDQPWAKTQMSPSSEGDDAVWYLERIDGNIYRIRSRLGEDIYLQGEFKDEKAWQDLQTADDHSDWNSQKFQLLRVEGNVYRIKCLWGDLYLTGRDVTDASEPATNIRTAPLNLDWTSQQWRLLPVANE